MREPAARPAAALLFHQTEEWVWPGGFLPWINRDVMGSDDDEFPIDRRLGFLINVGFGWGLTALAAAGTSPGPATALNVSHIGNAVLHVGWGLKHRRYDPGLVSAVTALLPVGAIGIARALRNPEVSRGSIAAGAAAGLVIAAGMMPSMKLRLHRRRATA